MMRAFLVGNRSVLGMLLSQRFENAGWFVTKAGRHGADYTFDLAAPYQSPNCISRHDALVHVAADFGGPTPDDLDRAARVNGLGALNVCRMASDLGAKIVVLISSISSTYKPGDAYFGSYALTKRHGEEMAQLYCQDTGMRLAILRPSQIYNDDNTCRKHQDLFYKFIDSACQGEDIVIYGSNDAIRNYIHINDVAEIVALIVEKNVTGVFDCPHPDNVRLSELAQVAQAVFSQGGQVKFLPEKPNIADLPMRSGDQIFRTVNYHPRISLVEGIQRIKSYRERNDR